MGRFRRFLNEALLKELHLHGHLFTWSNERLHPTLESALIESLLPPNGKTSSRIMIFKPSHPCAQTMHRCCYAWAMPSRLRKGFTSEAFSPGCRGLWRAWHCPLRNADPLRCLDWLLHNTARFLQSWSDRYVGSIGIQVEISKEVVLRLEMARDRRALSSHEEHLRQELKLKSLGLSSLPTLGGTFAMAE
jgi:hypothetical protein